MHDQEANNQLNLSVLASVWDSRCPGSPRNKDNKAMGKEIESDMAIFKLSSTAHRSDLLGHCYTKSEQLPSKNPIHWQMVQPPQGERIVLLRKVAQNRGRLVAFCSTRWPKKNSLLQAEEFFRHFFSPLFFALSPKLQASSNTCCIYQLSSLEISRSGQRAPSVLPRKALVHTELFSTVCTKVRPKF